jgi:DNA-directed RNA polymerase subunit RPC12/RpoP
MNQEEMDFTQYEYASEEVPYTVHCPNCGELADNVFDDHMALEPVYKCGDCEKLFMVREVTADREVFTTREVTEYETEND